MNTIWSVFIACHLWKENLKSRHRCKLGGSVNVSENLQSPNDFHGIRASAAKIEPTSSAENGRLNRTAMFGCSRPIFFRLHFRQLCPERNLPDIMSDLYPNRPDFSTAPVTSTPTAQGRNILLRNTLQKECSWTATVFWATVFGVVLGVAPADAWAWQPEVPQNVQLQEVGPAGLTLTDMLRAGGMIGYLIVLLSLIMVALIADHLLNIRRTTLMPPGLAQEVHRAISERRIDDAKKHCEELPSYLGRLLNSGLNEIGLGYSTIEKAMEDTAVEQSARLFRRIEYLSVIGTLAPMLGLMGTVWGMIQAFLEFEQKANPQVSELAPGIYRALITTLLGLTVAVPSLAAFAIFRNRIDELSAESTLLAEHVFADHRRSLRSKRRDKSE